MCLLHACGGWFARAYCESQTIDVDVGRFVDCFSIATAMRSLPIFWSRGSAGPLCPKSRLREMIGLPGAHSHVLDRDAHSLGFSGHAIFKTHMVHLPLADHRCNLQGPSESRLRGQGVLCGTARKACVDRMNSQDFWIVQHYPRFG